MYWNVGEMMVFILTLIATLSAFSSGQPEGCQHLVTTHEWIWSQWFNTPTNNGTESLLYRTDQHPAKILIQLSQYNYTDGQNHYKHIWGVTTKKDGYDAVIFQDLQKKRKLFVSGQGIDNPKEREYKKDQVEYFRVTSYDLVSWNLCQFDVTPRSSKEDSSNSVEDDSDSSEDDNSGQNDEDYGQNDDDSGQYDTEPKEDGISGPNSNKQPGDDGNTVLFVLVVLLAVVNMVITTGIVIYRNKWKKTLGEEIQGKREDEYDDPEEHVYEEWNPNYKEQGMNRYDSENSLYEPWTSPTDTVAHTQV